MEGTTAVEANPAMDSAIESLLLYQKRSEKKRSEISKELGISESALSLFLKGTYAAPHTVIPKINQLLKINEKKAASPKEPPFKMTSVSQAVTNIITYCHLQGKLGVAYGDAGIGKTMAIREYVRNNPESIAITISPCFATVTGVNELLADVLKIKEKISRRIFLEARERLKDSNRVIIIDEAQHLTVRVINHLRCLSDESGIGIAFVGNEEIYLKMKGAGQAAYAQLFSRIGDRAHVLTTQLKAKDISLVFEEAQLSDEAIGILHKISRTNYGLRGAVNVFVNTIIGFQIKDYSDMTAAKLASMAKDMNVISGAV